MKMILARGAMTLLASAALIGASVATASAQSGITPAEQAKRDNGIQAYTKADVEFMQGMIHHHSQAIVMANWAKSHGARPDVQVLADRIAVAQQDEINFMQRWLKERNQTVPEAMTNPEHATMDMGMPLMPGMLTPAQMRELDAAKGPKFDTLFLRDMIQHHTGALTMVDKLFGTPGAGQELYVFRFASDVNADQNTEIDRMHKMLGDQ